MAKRDFNWKTLPGNVGWSLHNAVTGAKLREYVFFDDESELTNERRLGLYGGKQLVADKTTAAGASEAKRLAGFDARYSQWRTGEWAFRDGHGTTAAKLPDALLYRAAVACNVFADTSDNRKIWAEATANARAAIYQKEGIAEWLATNAAGADAAADLLATLKP